MGHSDEQNEGPIQVVALKTTRDVVLDKFHQVCICLYVRAYVCFNTFETEMHLMVNHIS